MKHYATAITNLYAIAALSFTLTFVGWGTGNAIMANVAAMSTLALLLTASILLYHDDVRTNREFVQDYQQRQYARMLALSTMDDY